MILEGRIFKGNRLLHIHEVKYENPKVSFSKELEEALIILCREMDIPVPMWMKKNTHEFAAFHQTIFFDEQYPEKVKFEKFQIKMTR
ncbi:MAG: hypothetical protein IJ757_00350 [Clostridiales bacterium]|nr:hypothetical protein [Clostridiales bacterium]